MYAVGEAVMYVFFFQAEDGIRDVAVTGVQTCALPISSSLDESDDSPAAATSHSSSVGSLRPAQLQNASASPQFTCSTGRCASSGTHWSKFRRSQRPAASRFQYTG